LLPYLQLSSRAKRSVAEGPAFPTRPAPLLRATQRHSKTCLIKSKALIEAPVGNPGCIQSRVRRNNINQNLSQNRHWLVVTATLLLFAAVAFWVDLKPEVKENFFFAPNDPEFHQTAKIAKLFSGGSQMVINVAGPIASTRYQQKIARLTNEVEALKDVTSVNSLAEGPKGLEDAEKSAFWSRLLLADNRRSSNVVVFVNDEVDSEKLVSRLEAIDDKLETADFRIQMAGAPYIAEMMRRSLKHDFETFSLTSFLLFGAAMWLLLRSWKLTVGILATCSSAVLVTLLLQQALGQRIGILTANLTTIIFVITLSHLVYMTFNWQALAQEEGGTKDQQGLGGKAWRMTLPASFWSMVSASLGFGSLLLVRAEPLKQLGLGGTAGTIIALAVAYLMYPPFLDWERPDQTRTVGDGASNSPFWQNKFVWVAVATVVVSAGLSLGLMRLNTDPSLLDYFKAGRQPREGLEVVDRNGGTNPLTIVVAPKGGGRLDNGDQYDHMWNLQDALEKHKGVGTVLSLPVLMEEAHRHPFAPLLGWKKLVSILNEPKHQRVASTFLTKDRGLTAYYLRMDEHGRTLPRVAVVQELRELVRKQGFVPYLLGGAYELQGALAQMVAHSLVSGLGWLFVFFAAVALAVSRSIRVALAMVASLLLVPVCMLGGVGLLGVPVDIISAPATNVCIGMAIDSMVHLVFAVRRAKGKGPYTWKTWIAGRREQWKGIVFSDVIIGAGFAIFALSGFPPTQRFGIVVLAGTVIDIAANLFVLPLLGGADLRPHKLKAA
jgi:predicted RND superfamily exporter protein